MWGFLGREQTWRPPTCLLTWCSGQAAGGGDTPVSLLGGSGCPSVTPRVSWFLEQPPVLRVLPVPLQVLWVQPPGAARGRLASRSWCYAHARVCSVCARGSALGQSASSAPWKPCGGPHLCPSGGVPALPPDLAFLAGAGPRSRHLGLPSSPPVPGPFTPKRAPTCLSQLSSLAQAWRAPFEPLPMLLTQPILPAGRWPLARCSHPRASPNVVNLMPTNPLPARDFLPE